MKYKISWKHKKIKNYKGSGQPVFTDLKVIQIEVRQLNKNYTDIHHWVVEVDETPNQSSDNDVLPDSK